MANILALARDSLTNLVSRLGTDRDKAASSFYLMPILSDEQVINAYRGAWLPRKIVDIPAFDSVRAWRDRQADSTQDARRALLVPAVFLPTPRRAAQGRGQQLRGFGPCLPLAENETMKFHIKNNTHRTKAFKVWGGTEDVLPGKERVIDIEGDVSDEFIDRTKANGVEMKPAGKSKTEPADGDQPKTAADVLAMVDDKSVPFMSFKSAASKLLGDKTPANKAEIIARRARYPTVTNGPGGKLPGLTA